ncbi:MAG: DUF6089 family protein [Ferruginibacter sp.]|nr:outer membrane beta-barrel protein [Bacteroidota bacterium]MBX2917850.1 outer membrane beta-barrel protein [Ferruginibacter sp.]MCB0708664.1 outer membrane beta-barrel protein [Chitinophagaceae bacterium]
MKKITFLLSVIILIAVSGKKASAQYYFYDNKYYDNPVTFEVGASIGAMNCLTDIGGHKGVGENFVKDLNLGKTHISGGIFLSATYQYMFTLRLEGTFGKISGDDKVLESVRETTKRRYERNLNFFSKINEVTLGIEAHPLYIFGKNKEDKDPPRFSPYLYAGIGYFSFNPQTKLNGKTVDLQPLSTEGQGFAEYPDRKIYKLNKFNFPFGVGVKYDLSPLIYLRAEFIYRMTNTDYLDDVSTRYIDPTLYSKYFTGARLTNALLLNDRQYELDPTHITKPGDVRGRSKNKDSYFSFNVKVSYTFGREKIN